MTVISGRILGGDTQPSWDASKETPHSLGDSFWVATSGRATRPDWEAHLWGARSHPMGASHLGKVSLSSPQWGTAD